MTLRGNHREALFASPADRRILDDIVADTLAVTGAGIHAYCWMTNHLHALVQTAELPLGTVMQRIARQYSRYRHQRLATTGHLFERRYGARLIGDDAYFLTALRYIHLNPCVAGLVENPVDYAWSSHAVYLGHRSVPWVTTSFGLSLLFDGDLMRARAAYRAFFLDQSAEDCKTPASTPGRQAVRRPNAANIADQTPLLDQIAHEICRERLIDPASLRSPSVARHLTAARAELARRALAGRVATVGQIAAYLGRTSSAISQTLKRYGV